MVYGFPHYLLQHQIRTLAASLLEQAFEEHGPPLVLKQDRGSNLNSEPDNAGVLGAGAQAETMTPAPALTCNTAQKPIRGIPFLEGRDFCATNNTGCTHYVIDKPKRMDTHMAADPFELVELVLARKATEQQRRTLMDKAPSALAALVKGIEASPLNLFELEPFFVRSGSEATLAALSALAQNWENSDLSPLAIEALGNSGLTSALPILVDLLRDTPYVTTAALALGRLRDARAREVLLNTALGILDGPLELFPQRQAEWLKNGVCDPFGKLFAIAESLAHFGDHSLHPIPVTVLQSKPPTDPDDPFNNEVLPAAARTLRSVVGPGMIEALCRATRRETLELTEAALQALFLLGTPVVVPELLHHIRGSDSVVIDRATTLFAALTGAPTHLTPSELDTWWRKHGGSFHDECCYRFGAPYDPRQLLSMVDDDEWDHFVKWDLGFSLGCDFGIDSAVDMVRSPEPPQAGALYKLGHKLDLDTVLGTPRI